MINVTSAPYNAKGDNSTDNYSAFMAAISAAKASNDVVYVPAGTYLVSNTIVSQNFRGLLGDGKSATVIKAMTQANGATLASVLNVGTMIRGTLSDFHIDCNSAAKVGIISDSGIDGGSIDNTYSNIIIDNYTVCGWQANDNNNCYFEHILIPSSGMPSLISVASGGPLQFINCNFLGEVHVAAQVISFSYCVTGGIKICGPGFNVLKYEGGYAYASPLTSSVVYIDGGTSNNGYPSETSPITFSGSHIEFPNGGYLIGGPGHFHFGVNAIGCHLFNSQNTGAPSSSTNGNLVSPDVTSVFYPAATSKFSNCDFQQMNTPVTYNGFTFQYENCYFDNYYNNIPTYLSEAGGDVANVLGLPGNGQDQTGRASNRFEGGSSPTADGASYTVYDCTLRGHWGMALKDYNEDVTGFIDFRLGKIDLLGGFYVNGKQLPVLTNYNENSAQPGFSAGLPSYTTNAAAKAALGTNKLYQKTGVVMITY